MKITDVEVAYLKIPEIAGISNGTQDVAVVLVHTDEGITGIGEAESQPHVAKAIVDAPRSHSVMVGLKEVLVGENPLDIERLWRKMYQATIYMGRRGAVIHAISGVDIALWDIKGKAYGQPVCDLLGGSTDAKVRAYASALFGKDGVETAEKAARFKEAGYTAFKFGWMGKMSDSVTLGASYTTKMRMKRFEKYKDLFAEEGDFDMPESLNLGVAVKASPALTVAADYQRINYGGVRSVSNSSRMAGDGPPATAGGIANSLGCSTCRGFGWQSVDVLKLGFEYQYNPNLLLRAGWNHTDNPIRATDVTFNMIAPGVVKDHLTLGFTYNVSKDSELTMAYMHAFKNSVSGDSLFNKWVGGTAQDKIEMYQNSLGIAYGLKF